PGGKVDRGRLPDPEGLGLSIGTEYVAPENEVEEKLVEIWKEMLDIDIAQIGINDNFFDLGGDSIKIIRMIGLINKEFSRNISTLMVYKYPTISSFSKYVYFNDEGQQGKTDDYLSSSIDVMEGTINLLTQNNDNKK
ncbi:phosphopantetheine-binding protein, partial [Pedobacter jeongneungensis]|uniref:phosphopantetheine-binding protein n=1 Tax=Pedobacter jeongneungensis TaxID=947309 RepID=UPI0031E7A845